MRKRATRKSSAADLLVSSPPTASPNRSASESPKQFEFNLNTFNTTSSSKNKKKNSVASTSVPIKSNGSPMSLNTLATISDLKGFASLRLDSIKRQLDHSQSEILKDIEASQSRLHKRFKIQSQQCQQVVDEAEKEYRKMSERINESRVAMKTSYTEFMAEAQASASRVCKTSIPELSQSFEKAIDVLKNRYGNSSTLI
ncbi:uncharacterized protein LOC132284621 [Cornus florida]|uniref:uncharacterized protein LOC132284621 n=1 Tax=Cornus florida TaxID=4283 RepID=UPI0028999284|nr:uncharacterized protein LOC132284621 [Cornus florida]